MGTTLWKLESVVWSRQNRLTVNISPQFSEAILPDLETLTRRALGRSGLFFDGILLKEVSHLVLLYHNKTLWRQLHEP